MHINQTDRYFMRCRWCNSWHDGWWGRADADSSRTEQMQKNEIDCMCGENNYTVFKKTFWFGFEVYIVSVIKMGTCSCQSCWRTY